MRSKSSLKSSRNDEALVHAQESAVHMAYEKSRKTLLSLVEREKESDPN
jgi:hypothetical protein